MAGDLPNRISIDRDDLGFRPGLLAYPPERFKVLLDGAPVEGVITADVEAGMIIAYLRDDAGDWRFDADGLMRVQMDGQVEIRRG
ncbi:hypothetical protein ACLBYG_22375 [Methylobacterium sp. D53M]